MVCFFLVKLFSFCRVLRYSFFFFLRKVLGDGDGFGVCIGFCFFLHFFDFPKVGFFWGCFFLLFFGSSFLYFFHHVFFFLIWDFGGRFFLVFEGFAFGECFFWFFSKFFFSHVFF